MAYDEIADLILELTKSQIIREKDLNLYTKSQITI